MKHDTAIQILPLYKKLFNVKFDDYFHALTDIIDVDKNIVLTARQYNELCDPILDDDTYETACKIVESYNVQLDTMHTIECFFLRLLAQKYVYLIHENTVNEQIVRLHPNQFQNRLFLDHLTACKNRMTAETLNNLLYSLADTLKNIVNDNCDNDVIFVDYIDMIACFASTHDIDTLIADIDADF